MGNKTALESVVGEEVRLFAYPYGSFDARLVENVRDAGFVAAVTVEDAAVGAKSDPLRLPRLNVNAWSADMLACRLERLFSDRG